MNEINLKPCPFCGGKVGFNHNVELIPDGVVCQKCKIVVRYMRIKMKSKDNFEVPMKQMAEAWNRRAENG